MKVVPFLFPAFLLAYCGNGKQKVEPIATKPSEHVDPTADQRVRRQQSESYCLAHGIPIFHGPNSLFTETDSAVRLRTKDEIVDRALALLYIGLKGEGLPDKQLAALDKDWHITKSLSPKEKTFVEATNPTGQQKADALWRYESLHVLLWAVGYIDSLSYPNLGCNVEADVAIIHNLTEPAFRSKARLRSKKEILDQADLVLRLHWATEDARIEGKPAPAGLSPDVLMERHHVLNWLIRDGDSAWDDVQTNT
jgi:hypothetical protein